MKIIQDRLGACCLKIQGENGLEVSIAFDDSCQSKIPTVMFRASLNIYNGNKNVTTKTFDCNINGELYSPTVEELIKALQTLL